MDREHYFKKLGWSKSPFVKETSRDAPIVKRTEAYSFVSECIGGWDRVLVCIAPIGWGKTTFMYQIENNPPQEIDYVISFDGPEPIVVMKEKVLKVLPFYKKIFQTREISGFPEWFKQRLGSKRVLLLFDEAQDYDSKVFAWLRILHDKCGNVFMVFFGLRSLMDKLSAETSFRDRKSKEIDLKVFDSEHERLILEKRIEWVGGEGISPFMEDGVNSLCTRATVPRNLFDMGQEVIEYAAQNKIFSINRAHIEAAIGKVSRRATKDVKKVGGEGKEVEVYPYTIDDFPPYQQEVLNVLMQHEILTIKELSGMLNKDPEPTRVTIKRLRGLLGEDKKNTKVVFPVVVEVKNPKGGRKRYAYTLSDSARRILARK